jgi:2-polyprenyl-6-hydroxyphenyl methylase/3-demethylubiquinone-9 3-methyltransferase
MINLDEVATTLAALGPASRILEIGCGKGAMASRLTGVFPDSDYLGIDPMEDPGRNYCGNRAPTEFRRQFSAELLNQAPDPFDLVLVVDVLHHTPPGDRAALLADAAALTRPGGLIAVVDWEGGNGPADLFCYFTCRWLTRDRNVRFMRGSKFRTLVESALPGFTVAMDCRVPPHRQNLLLALRAPKTISGS